MLVLAGELVLDLALCLCCLGELPLRQCDTHESVFHGDIMLVKTQAICWIWKYIFPVYFSSINVSAVIDCSVHPLEVSSETPVDFN